MIGSIELLPPLQGFLVRDDNPPRALTYDQIVSIPRKQHNQFINIEPLLEEIDISDIDFMDWIIIGAGDRK